MNCSQLVHLARPLPRGLPCSCAGAQNIVSAQKANISDEGKLPILDASWWLSAITDIGILAIIALAFVVGGLVKGLIGGGLPSIVVPVMAIVVEPAFAAAITLVPVVATNLWQALDGRLLIPVLRRRFAVLLVTLFIGVLVGSQLLVGLPPRVRASNRRQRCRTESSSAFIPSVLNSQPT